MERARKATNLALVADLADYHTALDAFMASPSETTKRSVLGERAKLPDGASGDGVSVSLPNISTLDTMLSGLIAGAAKSSATSRRRLINTGLSP